jgi:RNA polymerase sigma factor for flagellar operon FliA
MDDAEVRARVGELVAGLVPQARSEAYKVWQRAPHALEMDELESLALSGLAAAGARWPAYCAEKGHDPGALEYFAAYALRRMRGSMFDWLRSQDWMTRSGRTRAKMLRDAGQDRGLSDAELAAATGLDITVVRETIASVSARPVSMDAEPHDVQSADDVEGQAVVSQVLNAACGVIDRLGDPFRTILVLRYYHGLAVPELAACLGLAADEASRLYQEALFEVHGAMLAAVA